MVGLVLVLVVGPKDMPRVLRAVAKFVGKARGMAREFQTSMMDVADAEEFRDVKKALQDAKSGKVDALADFANVREDAMGAAESSGLKDSVSSLKDAASEFTAVSRKEENSIAPPRPRKAKKAAKKTASTTAKAAAKPAAKKKTANKKTANKKTTSTKKAAS